MQTDYQVKQLLVDEIHADHEFNCRIDLAPIDVMELAKSIEDNGLIQPITVAEYDDEMKAKTGKNYLLVAGYRRHMAFRVLKKERIPATVFSGDIHMEEAIFMNLSENVQRKELNIMEEAHALGKVKELKMDEFEVARKIGKSRGWVQVRFMVLDLPIEVQKEVVAYNMTQANIRELRAIYMNTGQDKEQLYEAVKKLKDAKDNGRKNVTVQPKGKDNKRIRKKTEIQKLNDHMIDTIGAGLHSRVLAWAAGEISDSEVFDSIKEEAILIDIPYYPPESFDSFS